MSLRQVTEGERRTFSLPSPPSTNNLFLNTKRGRIKSVVYSDWISRAGWELKLAGACAPLICKQWAMEVRLPERSIDIDNVKALPDLFVSMGIVPDDKYMRELHVYRDHTLERGRCSVTIWGI